jgi:cobalt-zinc-cadmium efflux system outer membrane protein
MSITLHAQQNLTLQQSLKLARNNHPGLRALSQDIEAARTDITSARLRPNPNVNIQLLHIARLRDRAEGTSWTSGENTQYWYQLTKPLQVAGQRRYKIDMAERGVTQSKLDFEEASRNVFLDVASEWIDVWAAQVNLSLLQRGQRNIDSLVQVNQYRLRDKVITETDLLRTELLQQQYQRDIITARQELTGELQELRYLVGTRDSVSIAADDNEFYTLNMPLDSLLAQGVHQRTDVLSAKSSIDIASANIRLQRALAYPKPEIGGMWNPQNTVPYFGFFGTVQLPLFDRNQGEREKADVYKYQADQNLMATEQRANTEVIVAYRAYHTQRQNLADYRENLRRAQHILDNVRYSYLKGATTVIDYLEAHRSWLDTQQRYYDTMEAFRRSYVDLLFATGQLNQLAR